MKSVPFEAIQYIFHIQSSSYVLNADEFKLLFYANIVSFMF